MSDCLAGQDVPRRVCGRTRFPARRRRAVRAGAWRGRPGTSNPQCLLRWLLPALLAAGCGRQDAPRAPVAPPDGRRPSAATEHPRRIVCGSPAVTELIFSLAGGENVAGVSDFSDFPPEAADKPSIGGIMNPNRERLLMLRPDLILTQGRHDVLAAFAAEQGITFRSVTLDSLDDLFKAIETVSAAVGAPARGEALAAAIRADFDAVRACWAGRAVRSYMVVIGRPPGDLTGITTIGPGSFLADVAAVAGGTNVFSDAMGPYPQVSKEAITVRDPEVILELQPGLTSAAAAAGIAADWRRLRGLRAVRDGRVVVVTNSCVLIPGPRIAETARILAAALHPGVCP